MQIRRNTKAFKTILEIFSECQSKADRQSLIRLYITRAGHSIQEKISVQGTKGEAEFFYDFSYQAVLNNLKSSTHQLYQSDETPGVYFFRNNLRMDWDETPFEFDPTVTEVFAHLPELPTTRKKEKSDEFVMPDVTKKPEPVKKEKPTKTPAKAVMFVDHGPPPPDFKLKHQVTWTELDKVVYRQSKLNKRDVLNFYDQISSYLLPQLKDRPLMLRKQPESGPAQQVKNIDELPKKLLRDIPTWVQQTKDVDGNHQFMCNDREHLLLYVELECVQFDHSLSRKTSLEKPDFLVIGIEAASNFERLIETAHTAYEILQGLKLPSLLKTDGKSGLHVYIPLNGASTFETSEQMAMFLCKLIRLKVPSQVAIKGTADANYGKVILDPSLNSSSIAIVAPYSLLAGNSPTVATPLDWTELDRVFSPDDFHHQSIFDRLKSNGDLFEKLTKKKVDATEQLKLLHTHYSFLIAE